MDLLEQAREVSQNCLALAKTIPSRINKCGSAVRGKHHSTAPAMAGTRARPRVASASQRGVVP